MKIGFDLGGSLSEHKWLRGIARYQYYSTPNEVHIITLIEDGEQQDVQNRLEELDVPYDEVHYCIANGIPLVERAMLKVGVMRRHKIEVLFDDVKIIVDIVNENGFVGVLV